MAITQGTPYAGSAPTTAYEGTFIPEVWSGKLIEKFYAATVFGAIANTNYEGEIKSFGDKVQIRQRPSISINNYTLDQDLSVERPSADKITLTIDQGKYFNTVIDDVNKLQADINLLSEWASDASEQMKVTIDADILTFMKGAAHASNSGATAGAISGNIDLGVDTLGNGRVVTASDILQLIVDMGQVLDEQNIPETGRWLVLPAWACSRIKMSDLKDASISGDGSSILRNGRVGTIDRFTIYMSNQLPMGATETTAHVVYAGINNAVSFASQMVNNETIRSERTFGTLMRGLQVYGRAVTDSTSLVEAIIKPA